MKNSRDIFDLDDETADKCRALIDECGKAGIKILITSTFRDKASQDAIYAQGRTTPGKRVTNARGGWSFHQYRMAFDFCPLDANGKPDWTNTRAIQTVGALGERLGLDWGGDWTSFKDMPHFQNVRGLTLAKLRALYPEFERPFGERGFIRSK